MGGSHEQGTNNNSFGQGVSSRHNFYRRAGWECWSGVCREHWWLLRQGTEQSFGSGVSSVISVHADERMYRRCLVVALKVGAAASLLWKLRRSALLDGWTVL